MACAFASVQRVGERNWCGGVFAFAHRQSEHTVQLADEWNSWGGESTWCGDPDAPRTFAAERDRLQAVAGDRQRPTDVRCQAQYCVRWRYQCAGGGIGL